MAVELRSSARTLITFYCGLLSHLVSQTDGPLHLNLQLTRFFADRQFCVED